jgi:phage terminase large subunit-like protein
MRGIGGSYFANPPYGFADLGLDGLSSGKSPDRLDALVWAVTELTRLAGRQQGPRITFIGSDLPPLPRWTIPWGR